MAVVTKAALASSITTLLADNTTRGISEADLRSVTEDLKDSAIFVDGGSDIESALDTTLGNTSWKSGGGSYPVRDAANALALYNELSDGEIGFLAGQALRRDSSLTGTASATSDLGQDGFEVANLVALPVDAFGAVGSNASADQAGFEGVANALPAAGGIAVLSDGKDYTVNLTTLATAVGSKKILWTGGGRVNGAAIWALPGAQDGWDTTLARYIYNKQDAAALDGSYKDNRRNAAYTGGNGGDLDYIETWHTTIASTVGSSGNRKAEKAGLFRVDNNSDHANGIGLFAAAFAKANGAVWAIESSTHSENTPTQYAHRSAEFNVHGYGADPNQLRWVANFIAHNENLTYSGTPGTDEVGVGVEIYPDSADMDYGLRIRTLSGAGTTKGIVQESALRIDSQNNDLIQAVSGGEAGVFKFGSKLSSGIVGQFLGVGNNASAANVNYTEIRSQISTNTAGSHDGILKLMVSDSGTMTEFFRINAGAANPFQMLFGGALKDVTQGAVDTGGTGFRALVVPN